MENKEDFSKMNVYKKIQRIKLELSERELKKSGENKFSNFKYYELEDFLPSIIQLCDKYGLFTQPLFDKESAELVIINADNPEEIVVYTSPVRELELKGANAIQVLGGIQTYLRRYLYMAAFDITEGDPFDSERFEEKKKKKREKPAIEKIISECKKKFNEISDTKVKTETVAKMKDLGYNRFSDIASTEDAIKVAEIFNVEIPEGLQKEGE